MKEILNELTSRRSNIFPHLLDQLLRRQAIFLFPVKAEFIDDPEQAGTRQDLLRHGLESFAGVRVGRGNDIAFRPPLLDHKKRGLGCVTIGKSR
jgi:hypothetical protein